MLRALLLLLVLANGAFFLWSQGHLQAWGVAPAEQREPERLQQQIAPETVRLLNTPRDGSEADVPVSASDPTAANDAAEAAPPTAEAAAQAPVTAPAIAPTASPSAAPSTLPAAAPPAAPQAVVKPLPAVKPSPTVAPAATPPPAVPPVATAGARACWQAIGFTEPQADSLRASITLLGLPAGSWQIREVRSPARWLVYLGRFENAAQLERKRAELRGLKVEARTVTVPGLAPGLSLSSHPTEAAAREAQQAALGNGIRGARVAQAFAESVSYTLRLPAALPAQHSAVTALGPVLAGKTLKPCN